MGRIHRSVDGWILFALPAFALLAVFFVYPVLRFLSRALSEFPTDTESGLANFTAFFGNSLHVEILARTFVTAAAVTVACVVLGYPYAYLLTVTRRRWRLLLLGLIVVSFWQSIIVRNYALRILMRDNGVLNDLLAALRLPRVHLLGTTPGVMIGMCQIMLPFMILPLYASLRNIDRRLLLAAQTLGAPPRTAFWRVYVPLSVPGVLAGSLLVFVLALGFYITPALLGSPRNALLSQLIVLEVSRLLEWGRAAAMGVVLLVVALALVAAAARATRRRVALLSGSGTAGVFLPATGGPLTAGGVLLRVAGGAVALLLILPVLIVIPLSFTGRASFVFPPQSWSLRWYGELLTEPDWRDALVNSLRIGGLVVVVATVLGTAAALALNRTRVRGRSLLGALIVSPLIVPVVIIAVALYAVFLRWHLTGTTTGFVIGHTMLAMPLVFVAVSAALASFDRRLESAAATLGASRAKTLAKITIPLVLPAVGAGAAFAFIMSFDEVVVSLFIASPTRRTLPVQMMNSLEAVDPTMAAASTLLLAITTLFICLAIFVRKETLGESA
jgi:putative spermidine/putrescine transport system permease protein